jgi:hypothetical protein
MSRLTIHAFIPDGTLARNTLEVTVDGIYRGTANVEPGEMTTIDFPTVCPANKLIVTASNDFVPKRKGTGSNPRSLSWKLVDITTEHGA